MNCLPVETIKLICYFADVDTIEKLVINILDKQFWKEYFVSHNLKITNQRDNLKEWIDEFKISEILRLITELDKDEFVKIITNINVTTCFTEFKRHGPIAKFDTACDTIFVRSWAVCDRVYINDKRLTCYMVKKGRMYQILFKLFAQRSLLNYSIVGPDALPC